MMRSIQNGLIIAACAFFVLCALVFGGVLPVPSYPGNKDRQACAEWAAWRDSYFTTIVMSYGYSASDEAESNAAHPEAAQHMEEIRERCIAYGQKHNDACIKMVHEYQSALRHESVDLRLEAKRLSERCLEPAWYEFGA